MKVIVFENDNIFILIVIQKGVSNNDMGKELLLSGTYFSTGCYFRVSKVCRKIASECASLALCKNFTIR
jgi:hypothetical protein